MASMTIVELRRQLRVGATYNSTWIKEVQGPRTTKRRVVSQSKRVMQSEVLDGPKIGHVMRLEWAGVQANTKCGVITLCDEWDEFLKIDTIQE